MSINQPLVSVIIPSYNHSRFVAAAVKSVLSQSYKKIELIVIDDGSNDNSVQVLQELRNQHKFHLIAKPNEGLTKTLNVGLKLAAGELICFLASDDLMVEGRIREQVEIMQKDPAIDIVTAGVQLIDVNGRRLGKKRPKILGAVSFEGLFGRNSIFAPTAMMRASCFQKFGHYDESLPFEDYYYWLKVLSSGGVIQNFDRIWTMYRLDFNFKQSKLDWYYDGYIKTIEAYKNQPHYAAVKRRYDLVYAVKTVLVSGSEARNILRNRELDRGACLFLLLVAVVLPKTVRLWLMKQITILY